MVHSDLAIRSTIELLQHAVQSNCVVAMVERRSTIHSNGVSEECD